MTCISEIPFLAEINFTDTMIYKQHMLRGPISNVPHGFYEILNENGQVSLGFGSWKDGKPYKGYCCEINADGSHYHGEFLDGQRHGAGSTVVITGVNTVCTLNWGHWEQGVRCGDGCDISKETYFRGRYQNNLRNGYGQLYTRVPGVCFKLVYEGEFMDGEMAVPSSKRRKM